MRFSWTRGSVTLEATRADASTKATTPLGTSLWESRGVEMIVLSLVKCARGLEVSA